MSAIKQTLEEMDDFDFGQGEAISKDARRQRRWRMLNYERYRIRNRIESNNARAKKLGAPGRISVEDWFAILSLYGSACLSCGRADLELTIDHVIPFERGGANTKDNLQPLCDGCNKSKGTKSTDFRPEAVASNLRGG